MTEKNSIVWITGASSGIGKAIACEFVNNNIQVAASARSRESLERLKKELDKGEKDIELFPMDVRLKEEVIGAYQKLSKEYEVDCLINNAGSTSFKLAEENTLEEIDEIVTTNLLGSLYTIKAVLPQMIERKKGTIINIISVAAETVLKKSSVYAASKAGLLAYAKALREEVREHNIRVINIIPGATRSPIWPNFALEKYGDRMMSPAELAGLIHHVYNIKSNLVTEEITIRPIKGDL